MWQDQIKQKNSNNIGQKWNNKTKHKELINEITKYQDVHHHYSCQWQNATKKNKT